MQYNQLITDIQADIYSNGAELITGDILQNVLVAMVGALSSAGACYKGTITPASAAPADLDQATVYLALTAGTYTNFVDSNNDPIVTTGPALITYDGGASLVFSKTDLPFAEKGIEISVAAGKYLVINDPFATTSLLVEAIGGSGTKQLLLGNYPWGGNEVECRDINGFADYIVEEDNGGTTAKWLSHDEGLGVSVLHFDHAATVYIHVLAGTLSGYSVEDSNPIGIPDSTSINLEDVLLVTKSELPWKATVTPDEPYLDIFLNDGCVLAIDSVGDNSFHGLVCVDNVEGITSAVFVGDCDIDTSMDVTIGRNGDNDLVLEIQTNAGACSPPITVTCLNGTAPDHVEYNAISEIDLYTVTDTHPWTNLEAGGGSSDPTGVVSQTQTWSGSGSNPRTYTIDPASIVRGIIPQANIDLFVAAGATFNSVSGYFELNGLTDISYEEMKVIYNEFRQASSRRWGRLYYYARSRTNLPFYWYGLTASNHMDSNDMTNGLTYSQQEVFCMPPQVGTNVMSVGSVSALFYGANSLKTIINPFKISSGIIDYTFRAVSLEGMQLHGLTNSAKFEWSPNLTLASVVYMVENASNTSAITITLHATAYARCQADTTEYSYGGNTYTGILALATAHNITIASA